MALQVDIGQVLRFDNAWDYQGPAYSWARLRCSIGQKPLGIFDELLYEDSELILPATASWERFSQREIITITSKLARGGSYHLQVKIYEGVWLAEKIYAFWSLDNAIYVVKPEDIPPVEFRGLEVTISKT